MVWFTIWFLVILKIPVLYLAWVIWWAVKDPPEPGTATGGDEVFGDGGGPGWRPERGRRRLGGRGGGPHGTPVRRPARAHPVPVRGRR